ncbi:MAG: serine/threonine-protein kinase [Sorangiineae bacterium]|nr:serine/threonine-protein kinase [Polyangiaceae bacterium]MEB2321597.1 serine/threonine-protein kinase [Sorangiineae bacterium]
MGLPSEMTPKERALPEAIGRYRVVRRLGQGAMGRVLLAHDPVLDRDVAVKLLRDDLAIPPEQRQALIDRMRHEARAAARVSHPNLVALHDMGEDGELGLFLVFEYVEGPTLKERLLGGHLGAELAARFAREIGGALTTAHGAGVLHRDIKPENVILASTGAKIADFGIARVPDSTLTRDGGLLGTPAYSAPESVTGGNFSPLSDQFSMAATLWEALSGRRAFPGDDAIAVATRVTTDEPPRIAALCGLDEHVDTVFARALSKNPRARFASCEEFGRALAEALEVAPRARLPTLPDQRREERESELRHGGERRGLGFAIVGAGVGALLVFAGLRLQERLERLDAQAPSESETSSSGSSAPHPSRAAPPPPRRPRHVSAAPPTSGRGSDDGEPDGSSDAGAASEAGAEASAGSLLPSRAENESDAGILR